MQGRLALFDLDNTLLAGDSDHAWGEFLIERGLVDADRHRTDTDAHYQNYLAGNLEQAEQNYRRALNHNPEQVGSLLGMAEIEFGKNRYNRTKSYLARFERVSRHTPRSLWLGAQNAAKMGDLDAVASYGLKLEQIYPDSQETENYLDAKDSWLR